MTAVSVKQSCVESPALPSLFLERLVELSLIDHSAGDRVLRLSHESREAVCTILVKLGLVPERDLASHLSQFLELPLAAASDYPAEPLFAESIAPQFLRTARMLPLREDQDALLVAVADPFDGYGLQALRITTGRSVAPVIGVPAEIDQALSRLYAEDTSAHATANLVEVPDDDEVDLQRLRDLAAEAPVIRFVNQLIERAVESRASDIHVEPFDHRLQLRFRIDGVLREIDPPAANLRAAITSRIKLMAQLNIAERRLPQDGRLRIAVRGKEIDLRVSTVPTLHGESIVLRILDKGSVALELDRLGYAGDALKRYLDILDRPTGILLVTGPTGSGKTTTLYASLQRLNSSESKILTVEDPVEYELPGINQVQVKPKIGLTFANALRSLVRQDPDIILIGEIRDLETAEIAGQAALTGHKVLSTLHTNDAASSVTRLLDMGVQDFLITATLNGIVAQRLVRLLCPACKSSIPTAPGLASAFAQIDPALAASAIVCAPQGCERCDGSGYRGRIAIFEILAMNEETRRAIMQRKDTTRIREIAIESGMTTLYRCGLARVAAGETTLEEVLSATRDN